MAPSPEGVQGVAFRVIIPVTLVASTFAPTETMPGALRTVVEWNPVRALSNPARVRFGSPIPAASPGGRSSIAHPLAYSAVWIVAVVLVCAPLAIRAYRRSLPR